MFIKRKKLSWSLAIMISLLLGGGGIGYARVTGVCGNCHTMHNSQNNTHMILNTDIDGTSGGLHGGGYPNLTRGSCVGCHTGENTSTSTTPFVYNTGSVTYGTDTLAGGNFKWVVTDDAKGHNVKGIPGMTADLALTDGAPGDVNGSGLCFESCHKTLFAPKDPVELATGCEGCHLPKHHAPQQAADDVAVEANGYFRFLSGHTNGIGVHGIEDSNWEFTKSASDHNEYLGSTTSLTDNTMTRYCVGCHGDFHTQQDGNGEWIRHPSDAVLPNDGEYAAYTGYDPNVPVARPDLTNIALPSTVVPGTDMVMCLSCHRAHGSPNDDMLRWSYSGMVAGGGSADGTGCFTCHTKKDQ
ncbi:MAG: cytochrome c3 family protein [Thermodesulfobacteriota bacterium]|nr:cytochrome c3 family protein [Thermodesulfobacteriota bacterium]